VQTKFIVICPHCGQQIEVEITGAARAAK